MGDNGGVTEYTWRFGQDPPGPSVSRAWSSGSPPHSWWLPMGRSVSTPSLHSRSSSEGSCSPAAARGTCRRALPRSRDVSSCTRRLQSHCASTGALLGAEEYHDHAEWARGHHSWPYVTGPPRTAPGGMRVRRTPAGKPTVESDILRTSEYLDWKRSHGMARQWRGPHDGLVMGPAFFGKKTYFTDENFFGTAQQSYLPDLRRLNKISPHKIARVD